jgi:predicted transcriptional regulator
MSESYFDAVSRRRSKLEVKISILKAISEGATRQTHIMYRSNLSWSFAHMFIRTMEKQGLISTVVSKGRKSFTLTDRGKRALEAYTVVSTELDFDSLEPLQNAKFAADESFEGQNAIPIGFQSAQKG